MRSFNAVRPAPALTCLFAQAPRPPIGLDLGLHVGQPGGDAGAGIELDELHEAEAAGTLRTAIPPCSRGTDRRGLQSAGARVSQAEIRFVRCQQ